MRATSLDSVAAEQQRFMVRVYNWMGAGLGITGVMAFYIANTPAIFNIVMGNPIMPIVLIIAQIGLVFWCKSGHRCLFVICWAYWNNFFHLVCGLYSCLDHINFSSNCRNFWCNEFLWLHHQKGPYFLGKFSIYGPHRDYHCIAR